MKKIINFFSKWLDEEFWIALGTIIVATVVSVGLQYFLFWVGNSVESVEHLGYYLDTGVFVLLLILASPYLDPSQVFVYKETWIPGMIWVSAVHFAVLGVYVYFVYANLLALLIISLVLLLAGLLTLGKLKVDTTPIIIYSTLGLIYGLGAHFAMQLNGMGTPIDDTILFIISAVTIVSWFKPAFD